VGRDYLQAFSMAVTTSPAAAAAWFRSQYPGKSKAENLFLRDFVSSLLERHGNPARFAVFGLHAQDIIEYLDVSAFVKRAATWQELREKHQASDSRGKDFKTWLSATYGADFGDESLLRAAADVSCPPAELVELLEVCRRGRD
jgi:hypothetical protein